MRLASFNGGRLGLLTDAVVQDVTAWAFEHCPQRVEDPMIAFIHAWKPGAEPSGPTQATSGARLGPPLTHPSKIVAAAANYWKHTQEMNPGAAKENLGGIHEKGFFLKAPSSIIGPGDAIRLPFPDRRTDHEAELGVVIGKTAKNIPAARALDYVFGYTCLLDISVRGKEDRGLRKSFDTFTPLGPYVVTKDEVPDPNDVQITCKVNGEVRQDDTTGAMIMKVDELIAWMSRVMTLLPGDIVATGTPAGVAPLKPGDRIEVTIERLGTLAVHVEAS